MSQKIILASSSKYRKQLLEKICTHFDCISPDIDESRKSNESVISMVERLAQEKARAVESTLANNESALIIGSDQAADFEGKLIGKPGSHNAALEHLMSVSGKQMTLHTGLAVLNTQTGNLESTVVPYTVKYRQFDSETAENYLRLDKPYDCAGSLKVESYGIGLIESMEGSDPNALIGLPLIALTSLLKQEGYSLL